MKKRILSLILTVAMMLSVMAILPISVSAEEATFNGTTQLTIYNNADIAKFDEMVTAGTDFSGETVTLGNDLTLLSTFDGIGVAGKRFAGTFDGQGYTITANGHNVGDDHGLLEHHFSQITLVLGLQVAAPGYGIVELVVVLLQDLDGLGVGHMAEFVVQHIVQPVQQALIHKLVEEVHFLGGVLQHIGDDILDPTAKFFSRLPPCSSAVAGPVLMPWPPGVPRPAHVVIVSHWDPSQEEEVTNGRSSKNFLVKLQ